MTKSAPSRESAQIFLAKKNRFGLRGKLVFAIILVGAPLIVGLSISYLKGTEQLREMIGSNFEALATESALMIENEFLRVFTTDRALAFQAGNDPLARIKFEEIKKGVEDNYRFSWPTDNEIDKQQGLAKGVLDSWITVPGKNGLPIAPEIPAQGVVKVRATVATYGNKGEDGGDIILKTLTPIFSGKEPTFLGWLHREYDVEELLEPLIYPVQFGDTGHVMVVNNIGMVLSCPILPAGSLISDREEIMTRFTESDTGWVSTLGNGHGGRQASIIGHAILKGVNSYFFREETFHTFVWQDSEEIFVPFGNLKTGVAIAGIMALGLLGLLGYYINNRIVDPIRRLRQEAGHIAAGELDRNIEIKTGDEIEDLADQFNFMTSQLRSLVGSLEDKVEDRTRELKNTQTEKDRVMEQLIQSEKAAAIGTMTSGIGHEINNPLYAILGRAEAIRDGADIFRSREYGRDIIKYTKRIGQIVKDLAGYVRPSSGEKLELVDVNEKIGEAVSMATVSLLDDHLKIKKDLDHVPDVRCKPEELQQAIFNIVRNGIQAMRGKGTLKIVTRHEGSEVWISIKDFGIGISKENLGKVFDPFYTTRGPEEGEGLGLYITHQTIKKNGGYITVESEKGAGTVFTIKFPVVV